MYFYHHIFCVPNVKKYSDHPPPCSGSHCRDERWGPLALRPPRGLPHSLGAGVGSTRGLASFQQGGCIGLGVSPSAGCSTEACVAVWPPVCPVPCLCTRDAGKAQPQATFFSVRERLRCPKPEMGARQGVSTGNSVRLVCRWPAPGRGACPSAHLFSRGCFHVLPRLPAVPRGSRPSGSQLSEH